MVDGQERDAEAVRNALQPRHSVVVPGVARLLGAQLPDLLQGVDDDDADLRVRGQETDQLFLEAVAHDLGIRGKVDRPGLAARDLDEPPLQAIQGVLQAEVHDLAGATGKTPDGLSGGDPVREPEGEPGFADLGRSGEEGQALGKQSVHYENGVMELHVHDLVGSDVIQFCDPDPEHPAEKADRLILRHPQVLHGVIHHVASGTAAGQLGAEPGAVLVQPRLPAAMRADRQRRRIKVHGPVSQEVLQVGPELLPELGGSFLIHDAPPWCGCPGSGPFPGGPASVPRNRAPSGGKRSGACRSRSSCGPRRRRTRSGTDRGTAAQKR